MIRQFFNTSAAEIMNMVDISDKQILELSNGEVTKVAWWDDSAEKIKDSLIDLDIFGSYDDPTLMGHIKLPCPVVNIQYLYGIRPILSDLLKMDLQDVARIVYYSAGIVDEDGETKIYSAKDLASQKGALLGASAIEYLLKTKGKSADGIILHNIPVIPLCMRTKCKTDKEGDVYYQTSEINGAYMCVVMRASRIRKLVSIDAPEIILINERRMLQEYVDALINNGAKGRPHTNPEGIVSDDLLKLYHYINDSELEKHPHIDDIPHVELDTEKILELTKPFMSLSEDDETDYEKYHEGKAIVQDSIYPLIAPLVKEIKKKYFAPYIKDYDDSLNHMASIAAAEAIYEWKPEEGMPIERRLFIPIYSWLKCYTQKKTWHD